ncbi:MAG TPA: ABC transporter substrate-binding protein, partial [Steroidobacteraceae bacterium]|nr:ABC transporter substrate-binding protein [Steroidobacteraceae bacterium]
MRGFALIAAAALACSAAESVQAQTKEPIRIGVIAEESAIGGTGIVNGAHLAVDAINAAGGVDGRKLEIMQYDDHSSAA